MSSFTLTLFDEGAKHGFGVQRRDPDPATLDGFPLLVRAPQYGEGVWLEDGSASVAEIEAQHFGALRFGGVAVESVATALGTTAAHVRQALEYVEATRAT